MPSPQTTREIRKPSDWAALGWDLLVITLAAINLSLIVFDSLYAVPPIQNFFDAYFGVASAWYADHVHENFAVIDLWFVAFFVADVFIGWTVAIIQKRYLRWWFYPFAHWYDVLGCIPLAGFRWLRALRIIALVIRLQRLGLIQIQNWKIFQEFRKYYDVLIEELSDRVVENVLSSVQDEVRDGASQLPLRIATEVIRPRQQVLSEALAKGAGRVAGKAYGKNRKEFRDFVEEVVHRAIDTNAAMRGLDKVPFLGSTVVNALDSRMAGAVCSVIDEIIGSLGSEEFEILVRQMVDTVMSDFLTADSMPDDAIHDVLIEIIELLKEQVRVQRWKTKLNT